MTVLAAPRPSPPGGGSPGRLLTVEANEAAPCVGLREAFQGIARMTLELRGAVIHNVAMVKPFEVKDERSPRHPDATRY